tara:strand:+ start:1062 stop:1451 length:390 start_codon:yes stop_codon:yes gene_type:complete
MALHVLIWNRHPDAPCGNGNDNTFDWNGAAVCIDDSTPHGMSIAQVYACDHRNGQGYGASITLHPIACQSLDDAEAVALFLAHRIERLRTAALLYQSQRNQNRKSQNRAGRAESIADDSTLTADDSARS